MYYRILIRANGEVRYLYSGRKIPSLTAPGLVWEASDGGQYVYCSESDYQKFKHVFNADNKYTAVYSTTATDAKAEKRKMVNWVFSPVDYSHLAQERTHENVRTDLHLLKTVSVELQEQIKSFTREKRALFREKVGADESTTASINADIEEIDRAIDRLDKRREEHLPHVIEAAFALAFVDGMGVILHMEAPVLYGGDAAPWWSYEHTAVANAAVLKDAVVARPGNIQVKETLAMKLEELIRNDADHEADAYLPSGARQSQEAKRLVPRGWKVVKSFSAATEGRSANAVKDSDLKEILVSHIVAQASAAIVPPSEG